MQVLTKLRFDILLALNWQVDVFKTPCCVMFSNRQSTLGRQLP